MITLYGCFIPSLVIAVALTIFVFVFVIKNKRELIEEGYFPKVVKSGKETYQKLRGLAEFDKAYKEAKESNSKENANNLKIELAVSYLTKKYGNVDGNEILKSHIKDIVACKTIAELQDYISKI